MPNISDLNDINIGDVDVKYVYQGGNLVWEKPVDLPETDLPVALGLKMNLSDKVNNDIERSTLSNDAEIWQWDDIVYDHNGIKDPEDDAQTSGPLKQSDLSLLCYLTRDNQKYLYVTNLEWSNAQHLFVVCKPAGSTWYRMFTPMFSSNNNDSVFGRNDGSAWFRINTNSGVKQYTVSALSTSKTVLSVGFDTTLNTLQVYRNNNSLFTTTDTDTITKGQDEFYISPPGHNTTNAYYYEFVYYDRLLSDQERTDVTNFLMNKYSIS